MGGADKLIGYNLQRMRRDRSQTEVANAMKARGHRWTQPTVVAVEKGERPLRMSEAADLVEILGIEGISALWSFLILTPQLEIAERTKPANQSMAEIRLSLDVAAESFAESADRLSHPSILGRVDGSKLIRFLRDVAEASERDAEVWEERAVELVGLINEVQADFASKATDGEHQAEA